MAVARVNEEVLQDLRGFDTCTVANAVETFDVRLRNTGFTDASVHCMFEDAPPMVGYAVTGRLRSGEPPIAGKFHDRADFWNSMLAIPAPRVLVLQDMDDPPGRGAFMGDMHAAILGALGCVGYLTNGAVRELPAVRTMGLQLFAGSVAVSHAYAHIFDLGAAVSVGNLEVRPGDLLHGDRHGVLMIPTAIAAAVPRVAAELQKSEEKVIDFCRSADFSIAKLREVLKTIG
ncbi:MAG TPA: RraA family protein [Candidatus Sulfotelmatobacter sp.]|nr:RraA family protein [Candidatus Sulfotelmatobacter sp.]